MSGADQPGNTLRSQQHGGWHTRFVGAFGQSVSDNVDVSKAAWIAPLLDEAWTVGKLIPEGYECHFVIPHPDMSLAEARHQVDAGLASVLCEHAGFKGPLFLAIWEGYGWPGVVQTTSTDAADRRAIAEENDRRREAVNRALGSAPTFGLPDRRYYLQVGQCGAAHQLTEPGLEGRQPPDLWWPEGHSWFVATDIDLACTYVGGPAALQQSLDEVFGTAVEHAQRSDLLELS